MKNAIRLAASLILASLNLPLLSLTVFAADPTPQTPKEQEIVKITLHPMAETRPALKYQLLPPFLDRRPGNAAVRWNRLPAEQTAFLVEFSKPDGLWEKAEKWMAIPLGDPREKEFRTKEPAVNRLLQSGLFAEMDYAARFESCDWELPLREGRVFEMVIPEAQMARTWGRMLTAKIHAEIADKKYGDAAHTMQTGFALARHTAQGQTLIHGLVGTAIAGQMTGQIEQLIQQPDAPNFYWSLTILPRPLIDFRSAYEFEMNGLILHFTELQGLDKKKLSKEEWSALLGHFVHDFSEFGKMLGNVNDPGNGGFREVAVMGQILLGYPRAKQYLIDHGRSKADVEGMPPAQVILLYTLELHEELRDELYKAMFLPYPDAKLQLARAEAELKKRGKEEIIPVASMLLPTLSSVKQTQTRTQWTIARLEILEALRIYAAAHGGALPEQLSDIHEVPVPLNPFDERPFAWHRDGARGTLDCEIGPKNLPWRYEITMQPAK